MPNPEQDAVYKEYCARQNFYDDLEERRNDVQDEIDNVKDAG